MNISTRCIDPPNGLHLHLLVAFGGAVASAVEAQRVFVS